MFEYSSVYFVPSHRTIEDENLIDFLSEVMFALRDKRKNIPFVLLDDTDTDINASKLASYSRDFNGVDRFVINRGSITRIYDEISADLEPQFRPIFQTLYPRGIVNYGNTLNKMFIMAEIFGAAAFHRRDSDVLSDVSQATSQKVYPIQVELDFLGGNTDGRTVYIVGSGYKGMRNIDYGEIIGNDVSLYKEYLGCLSLPEEDQNEELSKFQRNDRDKPFMVDQHRLNGDPECGNIAFYDIFRYIPSSPAPYTLGTDYFTKEIVNQAGLGLVHHNRRVIHRHTPCRYDTRAKVLTYMRGMASYVDSMYFYADFFVNMEAEMVDGRSFEDQLPELVDRLVEYYRQVIGRMDVRMAERRDAYRRFVELLKKSKNPDIRDAVPILLDEENEIFCHTQNLVTKHVELIEAWPLIISAAGRARLKPAVQEILQASEVA